MKFFLDENFPLRLHHRLQAEGIDSEHLITVGQRGIPDAEVVERLARGTSCCCLPIERRIEIWLGVIRRYIETQPPGTRFEISQSGDLERLPE